MAVSNTNNDSKTSTTTTAGSGDQQLKLPAGVHERLSKMGYQLQRTQPLSSSSSSSASTATSYSEEQQQEQQEPSASRRRRLVGAEEKIARLEQHVATLETKCGSYEAQNILVPVQQMDLCARAIALFCSLSCWFLWGRLSWTVLTILLLGREEEDVSSSGSLSSWWWWFGMMVMMVVRWGLWLALLSVPYFYHLQTHGSAHRRFHVFAVAFIIIARVRLGRWREQLFLPPPPPANEGTDNTTTVTTKSQTQPTRTGNNNNIHDKDEELLVVETVDDVNVKTKDDADPNIKNAVPIYGESITEETLWEAHYEVSARLLYVSILRLRGLWTKTAQYLSSRADFMPVSYVRELKRLQDETTATPWHEIEQSKDGLLPPSIRNELMDIDPTPLASASIGQVHTARLKTTGEKVVIKVQHPHARSLILDDFWSLSVILRIVSWCEPDYEFLEILMREWAKEAKKELDFHREVQNLKDAQASIQQFWTTPDTVVYTNTTPAVPFQVEIPTPIEHLCTDRVLVMSYCEGVRVDSFQKLDEWKLPRLAVMDAVAQTFAHMMYTTTIFNGDPHPGNLFIRPGTSTTTTPPGEGNRGGEKGFTLVLLDWGLAKRLTEPKRLAFCELVYSAATLDYGLLLDSFKNIGLQMKKEESTQSMENIRFFLRDMAPRDVARKRIKAKIRRDEAHRKTLKKEEQVPMKSKAYPGEFFFFVRVNELLHGLGSKFNVDMAYLDVLKPYAERGLRQSQLYCYGRVNSEISPTLLLQQERRAQLFTDKSAVDYSLESKLSHVFADLEREGKIAGAQFFVVNQNGKTVANVVAGHLGGLKSHLPMDTFTLVLGFSCTKAVTATLAHIMVKEGYLTYDEPICRRVWPAFCPTVKPPTGLDQALGLSMEETCQRWSWKRRISLWHVLTHQSGMWSAMPAKLTIKSGANCEKCVMAYEYNPDCPEDTLLPTSVPGAKCEYHYMSFGWLIAGALCGAYAKKHGLQYISFEALYRAILHPKLSDTTKQSGFRPCGGAGGFAVANTAIDDISTSKLLQARRESRPLSDTNRTDDDDDEGEEMPEDLKGFRGKEFLADPRIWNSMDSIDANTPAAGGRFSAAGLAHFYHDLGSGRILEKNILNDITNFRMDRMRLSALQGVSSTTNNSGSEDEQRTQMGCGYNLIRFDRDTEDNCSAFGHAGVGGSIGFHHKNTGLSVALMLNKADGGRDITIRILKVFGEHYKL